MHDFLFKLVKPANFFFKLQTLITIYSLKIRTQKDTQ